DRCAEGPRGSRRTLASPCGDSQQTARSEVHARSGPPPLRTPTGQAKHRYMSSDVRVAIERASSNDVMELVCDSTGTSMQVAAVLVLETPSPVDLAAVRETISDRITAVPRLHQRLVKTPFGHGRPVWIDDP